MTNVQTVEPEDSPFTPRDHEYYMTEEEIDCEVAESLAMDEEKEAEEKSLSLFWKRVRLVENYRTFVKRLLETKTIDNIHMFPKSKLTHANIEETARKMVHAPQGSPLVKFLIENFSVPISKEKARRESGPIPAGKV